MPETRCPAALPDDPRPCDGRLAVTVLDAANAGADGCEAHGARLLAALDGARPVALPDAPAGAALRVFRVACAERPARRAAGLAELVLALQTQAVTA
ncbi:hypothetical protein [Streptomyces silvensis]|uniref:hypothetical protein n=1 Tax=Streptomyces silvensis TaxID=1765722 RepID=UPI0007C6F7EC|nr:hypothetical protein [Streptomyces silvensis]